MAGAATAAGAMRAATKIFLHDDEERTLQIQACHSFLWRIGNTTHEVGFHREIRCVVVDVDDGHHKKITKGRLLPAWSLTIVLPDGFRITTVDIRRNVVNSFCGR